MEEKTKSLVTILTASAMAGIGIIVGFDGIADMTHGVLSTTNITLGNASELAVGSGMITYGIGLLGKYIKEA